MSINSIQFQKGLSLEEFFSEYGTVEQCETHLEKMRWGSGFVCPKCQGTRVCLTHKKKNKIWDCLTCHYQCSLISGTVFEHTKLPLTKWFLAIYLLTQSKNSISALELKRQLGVRYPAAWMMKHKLLEVMRQLEDSRMLDERVEIDDAYLGGELSGGKRGRGSQNKVPFVAAVQTTSDGKPHLVKFSPVQAFSTEAIMQWAATSLFPTALVLSDGLACFGAVSEFATHSPCVVGGGSQSVKKPEFRWVNTLLGNLKRSLNGTCHAFKYAKYADRYLAEFAYRFNRRYDLASMIPRLLYIAVRTKPMNSSEIRASEDKG